MGYDSDLDKEMKRNSDPDKKMEHNSNLDKEMEHDTNSDKEMEHNPNLDAIFKTKEPHLIGLEDTTMIMKEYNPYNSKKNSGTYELYNTASIYQHFTQDKMNSARKILLEGAEEGMIMIVTPQDCVVHWLGSFTSSKAQTGMYIEELPYQEGKELGSSSETIDSSTKQRMKYHIRRAQKKYTIYMVEQLEQPLEPPQIPDIKSLDESEGNISPDEKSDINENDERRLARLKKNKMKAGRRNRAKQRKQIWNKYKAELMEYNRKKVEREATKNIKRERIKELTKELYTLMNNGKTKEDQKKEVEGSENNPTKKFHRSHKESNHPKKSSFQRLEPVESANVNGRQEHYLKKQESWLST
ncbi:uncharacterized protein [Miscanthus floridulus]|uniref:uncharacterized protein n=1 Tax=Miscanthus floridulus TaxID=154761 RepID=UPI00345B411E